MLKVKNRSSTNDGSGSTIMDSTMTMKTGAISALPIAALPPVRLEMNFWMLSMEGL